MESIAERIVSLVLLKVGMDGPRRVTIGSTRKSGDHSYRDFTVDGHPPTACLEEVADAMAAWFIEHARSTVNYSGASWVIGSEEYAPREIPIL
jgi:hypothetical protein